VVTVNLDPRTALHTESGITPVVGNACGLSLPTGMATRRFDLVYSTSVLEHLVGHYRRKQFADTVHSHAEHHPGPVAVSRHWGHGHVPRAGRAQATRDVQEVELLSAAEMRSYFPASTIWAERFAGLPLVARK
jgi:hypothetical protein